MSEIFPKKFTVFFIMSEVISTPDAPAAIGPYVQARKIGNTLYTSGNVAIDPKTGKTPEGIGEQTTLALKNLDAVLKAAGFSKTDVIKCNLFIADMNDFNEMNAAYSEYFGDHKPCRCCTQAGKLCDPFKFELDCVAIKA